MREGVEAQSGLNHIEIIIGLLLLFMGVPDARSVRT